MSTPKPMSRPTSPMISPKPVVIAATLAVVLLVVFAEQNGYWLPERLKLHGKDLDVTLVVKDWQPRQLGH